MRNKYNAQLQKLFCDICAMGEETTKLVTLAIQAIFCHDEYAKDAAKTLLQTIDHALYDITQDTRTIIIQQQPIARDLALVNMVQVTVLDIARIATQGVAISNISSTTGTATKTDMKSLALMGDITTQMLEDCIQALKDKDGEKLEQVIVQDDALDKLFRECKANLATMLSTGGIQEERASSLLDFLLIAKYMERIGDHTVNIAKNAIKIIN